MEEIFRSRPFKVRNADEYDVSNILSLFVNPINGLATPFDYENSIIKGRMGSGKTMYLRANHAYYLSALVPSLIEKTDELILPVLIRLNDFQHIKEPSEIYRAIIIKVIEELTSIYLHLEDMKHLAAIQSGIQQIPENLLGAHKLAASLKQLAQLGSDEYIERVSTELGLKGGIKPKFFELSADWKNSTLTELKKKPNPGIKDIEECYKNLLEGQEGKILLLIDEAGSLDKSFFKNAEDTCFFEVLMNQFRTAAFIRTKIAVYPNSFSDMLTETRYGDAVVLEDDIFNDQGYSRFRSRTLDMICNYLNPNSYENTEILPQDIFNISDNHHDPIEQIIFASNGNMRRMMQLLDLTMDAAYSENSCAVKVEKRHATSALVSHANSSESEFNPQELELLHSLVTVCKARGAFKFQFPNVPLYKYTNKSQEYNLINVVQLGSGRRPTTYAFDYSYAVAKEIPTHRMANSERVCHERSVAEGRWLTRSATISEELIQHAALPGKQEGNVDYMRGESGFITSDGGEEYYFTCGDVIQADKSKLVVVGKRVRFYPSKLGDAKMAALIEVL
tara:strand:- start:84 stop:1772 length:1689 start_codon:yes stop_codon:yes gene_type:complete